MSAPSSRVRKVVVKRTADDASEAVFEQIADLVRSKPNCVLGLATGSTPLTVYRKLADAHKRGELDFSRVTTINLDEYLGVTKTHDQSYNYFMNHNLFDHINVPKDHIHVPNPEAPDAAKEAEQYEAMIERLGPVDLWLVGIGRNGHVAFNEPGSSPESRTRVVELTPSTIEANARFFKSAEEVPRRAISVGLGTLRHHARRIVMLATGSDKADAIRRTITGGPTPDCPASLLADKLEVYCDSAACPECHCCDGKKD